MIEPDFRLHVLFVKEGDLWVVFCLEHSLVVHGKTREEAKESFAYVVITQLAINDAFKEKPFQGCKKVPKFFENAYERAEKLADEALVPTRTSELWLKKMPSEQSQQSDFIPCLERVERLNPPTWMIDAFKKADVRQITR